MSQDPPPSPSRTLRHELRTPLNQIIGYCEMLMEEAQGAPPAFVALMSDLQRIHSAGRRLLGVVDDILDPAKAAFYLSNPGALDHEVRTPLNHIIGYAEMLQEEADEHGQEPLAEDLQRIHVAARELSRRVFEHFLPLAAPESAPLNPPARAEGTPFSAAKRSDSPSTQSAPVIGSLLVVDDDEANRTMLTRRLARLGHTVLAAADGREVLDRLHDAPVDLLLLDIQMPVMNGFEVLGAMKADPALSQVPVIVLSASSETDSVARCIELGAEDYLPKPFDAVLLQARINACLEKKRLRDREVSHLSQIEQEKQRLTAALSSLELAHREAALLDSVTQRINAGLGLRQVLDHIYESFEPIIPYDRIGCSLIDSEGATISARWARSRSGKVCMPAGYASPLAGSSLQSIVETGTPRILNDLEDYLRSHPASAPTRLMVEEGMRSSLTCPLISMGNAVGFLFFNSGRKDAYRESHARTFMRVANHLSTIVRKGMMYDEIGEELHKSEERFAHTQAQLLAAQQIQQRLLPRTAPAIPGLDIAGACYPSHFAAGDYFNYLPMSDGSLVLVIADVTGHGVGPALVAATVHAYLGSMVETAVPIDEITSRLNRRLCQESEGSRFVTLLLARLEPESRSLHFVNAGHPSGQVIDRSGSVKATMDSGALPLGIDPDALFPMSQRIALEPGDLVFLMTDGIFEAPSPQDQLLGLKRTMQLVLANRAKPAAELIVAMRDAVLEFSQRTMPHDDLTVVVAKVADAPAADHAEF
jgi:serine phosphatase RsbU (regulator of sigma subunit)/DNA-binding response OmpR family regulator